MTGEVHSELCFHSLIHTSSVSPRGSLLEAIAALDRSPGQLALVMESASSKLLGLLTDGDIRRALLAGRRLSDSIEDLYTRDFFRVPPSSGRAEVIELMHSHQLRHVPIVDDSGQLLGLHLWTQMLSRETRENFACILVGGRGTRLLPLTEHVPKPMLKVAGRPILERILLHLLGHGFRNFYFAINYLGSVVEEHFGDGSSYGCKIVYLRENKPLGTGGPLSLIPEVNNLPLLVMNGDLITRFNAGQMLKLHQSCGYGLTVASRLYQHNIPFGCLSLENGLVRGLEEKPAIAKHINAGIYVLEPEILKRVPGNVEYPMTQLVEELLRDQVPVGAYEIQDDWTDIGRTSELERARGDNCD